MLDRVLYASRQRAVAAGRGPASGTRTVRRPNRWRGGGAIVATAKRIHELAKEWAVQPKDVLAAAEQLGLKGKRSQSVVSEDEAQRLKQSLGLSPRAPHVTVGAERVVAERVV